MKKQTLATAFAALREKSGLSMLAVAQKCDISETTVWKVEHGLSVRWETIHLILTASMRVPTGSQQYQDFQALWVKQRQEMAESQSPEFGRPRMSPSAVAAVRKFRKLVHDMDEKRLKRFMAAVTQSARR
jgi:transcriptional regulator with XRE-family HTH domain